LPSSIAKIDARIGDRIFSAAIATVAHQNSQAPTAQGPQHPSVEQAIKSVMQSRKM